MGEILIKKLLALPQSGPMSGCERGVGCCCRCPALRCLEDSSLEGHLASSNDILDTSDRWIWIPISGGGGHACIVETGVRDGTSVWSKSVESASSRHSDGVESSQSAVTMSGGRDGRGI
jgi:hypothetical protein